MIIGVNRGAIQRNILGHLYNKLEFPCPTEKAQMGIIYGRKVWFVGAPDIGAASTIQGSTLALAYVDEATNLPETFWRMLESRLSVPGAKIIATCNPEGPAHFIKKDYIDNKNLDLISWNFTLDDNPSLDEAFKQQLKASYSGMWAKRYILGQWAMATGAVFDSFDEINVYDREYPAPTYYCAGLDYGTINPTCCHIAAVSPNQWPQIRIEREYYFDSMVAGRAKTDSELARDIKEFLSYVPISALYVDPAAASLKLELRNLDLPVIDANNDVLFGIKTMSKYIGGRNLLIHKSCKNLIDQIQSYAWDSKASDKGEDKPIKKDDHAVDSCRYLLASAFKNGLHQSPFDTMTNEQYRRHVFDEDDRYTQFNTNLGHH
jgi:PBSX family phage terminase large subunit